MRIIKPDGKLAGRVDGSGETSGLPSGWVSLLAIRPELASRVEPHASDFAWLETCKVRGR